MVAGKNNFSFSKQYKREVALGIHTFKVGGQDGICRWLDIGAIVEFTAMEHSGQFNAQYEINGRQDHKIWFSQLSGVYLNPNDLSCVAESDIFFKDGNEMTIRSLSPMSFWNKVKGKKFRVSVDCDFPIVIDVWNEKVRKLRTMRQVVTYIAENLDKENYEAVKGMTKKSIMYSLTEV